MRARGDRGEEAARRVLTRAGYKIILNNFCVQGGEIDIIARAADGTVVFVEVKLRAREPPDHRAVLPASKLLHVRRAARYYLSEHAVRPERIRFDLLLLIAREQTGNARVFWYKNF